MYEISQISVHSPLIRNNLQLVFNVCLSINKTSKKKNYTVDPRAGVKQYILTCPVSVSNLYSRIAGLLEPMLVFFGVTDGAIIIHETGIPAGVGKGKYMNEISRQICIGQNYIIQQHTKF